MYRLAKGYDRVRKAEHRLFLTGPAASHAGGDYYFWRLCGETCQLGDSTGWTGNQCIWFAGHINLSVCLRFRLLQATDAGECRAHEPGSRPIVLLGVLCPSVWRKSRLFLGVDHVCPDIVSVLVPNCRIDDLGREMEGPTWSPAVPPVYMIVSIALSGILVVNGDTPLGRV
ncbi:hypothetical protein VTN77DRAFT_1936 [Rasamsonia byssochlamydoides]|uniref:uncharacterized protein n=1 Tax=Rasamsonia byssochlamydoides TaxID=89139 RepID=UPI003742DEDD